jgi:hypothetical protein
MMLHNLTIGQSDPDAVVVERRVAVRRPLDIGAFHRLFKELSGVDQDGVPMLERG